MSTKTWLIASFAISLSIGYGARIMTGDAAPAEGTRVANLSDSGMESAPAAVWTHPAVTVVVKVPAKTQVATRKAISGGTLVRNDQSAGDQAVLATYTHPELSVVVKVPATAERSFPGRAGAALSRRIPEELRRPDSSTTPDVSAEEAIGQSGRDGRDFGPWIRGRNRLPGAPGDSIQGTGDIQEIAPPSSESEQAVSIPQLQI